MRETIKALHLTFCLENANYKTQVENTFTNKNKNKKAHENLLMPSKLKSKTSSCWHLYILVFKGCTLWAKYLCLFCWTFFIGFYNCSWGSTINALLKSGSSIFCSSSVLSSLSENQHIFTCFLTLHTTTNNIFYLDHLQLKIIFRARSFSFSCHVILDS